ncbi:uncharacterized protein LOC116410833 [Xenopus tropicalis]|uniref:Uncharacterized protein LOC116410833 n=1 Tax=Xenopus tropicalis TaxID=8364 RepID=A0A8J1JIZ7_XENTR|nr:uncharacterized protein LOC116410833 [Xenopus tropicalis]
MDSADWTLLRLWGLCCVTVSFIAGTRELNLSHSPCAGFLQLCANSNCLRFCGTRWNEKSGHVACAQLNCGTALLALTDLSDSRDRQRHLVPQEYWCHGNESSMERCPISEQQENCTGNPVFLICTGMGQEITVENLTADPEPQVSPTRPTGTSLVKLPCNLEPCSEQSLLVPLLGLLLGLSLLCLLAMCCCPPILRKIRRRVSKKTESQWIGPTRARHNASFHQTQGGGAAQSQGHRSEPNEYCQAPHCHLLSAYPALEGLLRVPDTLSESEYDLGSLRPL